MKKKNIDKKIILPDGIIASPTDAQVREILAKGIKDAEMDDVKYAAIESFIPTQDHVPPMPLTEEKKDKE